MSLFNIQSISPNKIIRGKKAWEEAKIYIHNICKKPLLIGRSDCTKRIRNQLNCDLLNLGLSTTICDLNYDCCYLDLDRACKISKINKCDGIIAAGGGKVLDAGKLIADKLSISCITIPLSASTCAGWTSLSNIYSPEGAFIKDINLTKCPDLLIFDHDFVRNAPPRTLASGIADALAKWYEASLTSTVSEDGFVQQAVQMARVLRDQLFLNGQEAFTNPQSNSWITVAEGCALTAGIIGGLGGAKCRTAAAHPIHNGLTQLEFENKPLHGELVGLGTVLQLHLEELNCNSQLPKQAKTQLINFLSKLNLPLSIESIGLKNINSKALRKACRFTCSEDSDIHQIPFMVNEESLLEAICNYEQFNIKSKSNSTIK